MADRRWFHGGIGGMQRGSLLVPAPPVPTDGCPVCVARVEGRVYTVGEYREWIGQFGEKARPALDALTGAPDSAPLDPPSEFEGVYATTHEGYAAWYAARSHGDLYEVQPLGEQVTSPTDHFPTVVTPTARVLRVLRRDVRLDRRERRALMREWQKADERAEAAPRG